MSLPNSLAGLVPPRTAWLRLLASPSSYLLVLALGITAVAKIHVLRGVEGVGAWPLWSLASIAVDGALYAGLAALFAVAEWRVPKLGALTIPIAAAVAGFAALNGSYLMLAGEQLSAESLALGFERLSDVSGIAAAATGGATLWLVIAAAIAAPLIALSILRRGGHALGPFSSSSSRAHAAALIAAVALLAYLVTPRADAYAVDRLANNALVSSYLGLLESAGEPPSIWFEGYKPPYLLREGQVAELAKRRAPSPPNIIVVVLESTRRDITTLARKDGEAATPNLEALAARGLEASSARAVMPHTTKSLFSILCGRMPLLQYNIYESTGAIPLQCLPAALKSAGFRTAFFQGAVGVFEDRPRLAHKLGFDRFGAWEDVGGEPLGYFSSDDLDLLTALHTFLDQGDAQGDDQGHRQRQGQPAPFFVTLLTSATHHPYRLSPAHAEQARAAGRPQATDRERYARLIERGDQLVGEIAQELERRGLSDSTILAVVGDHGEGFGDRGLQQHDNNFLDEGLRVPFVVAGPGIPRREVAGDASLLDLVPTLLDAIGMPPPPEVLEASPGRSLLEDIDPTRLLVFSCYQFGRCFGAVSGGHKVVYLVDLNRAFWFDLRQDPEERSPKPLSPEHIDLLEQTRTIIDAHRINIEIEERAEMNAYPPWVCPANQHCAHPRSPEGGMFVAP